MTNISVSDTELLAAASCSELTLCWRNPRKQLMYTTNMAFCAEDRVLIKVLRQEKVYGARVWDLGEAAEACVSQPDLWRRSAEVAPDGRVGTFPPGVHRWSDQAVASSSLYSSTWRTFWTQTSAMFDVYTHVHTDRHVCAVATEDTLCFGMTSLNLL